MEFMKKSLNFKNIVFRNYGKRHHVGLGQKDVRDLSKLHFATPFVFYSLDQIANMSLNDLRR
jgi:hypothetical protein